MKTPQTMKVKQSQNPFIWGKQQYLSTYLWDRYTDTTTPDAELSKRNGNKTNKKHHELSSLKLQGRGASGFVFDYASMLYRNMNY